MSNENYWERKAREAASGPNKDLHVQITEPLFDKVSVLATIQDVEPQEDQTGESLRLRFRFEEETQTVEGLKKAPGHVFSPRPYTLLSDQNERSIAAAERGRRDVGSLCIAAGLLKRGSAPSYAELLRAIGQLKDRKVVLKLEVNLGSKRGVDGEFPMFQNVRFAAATGGTAPAPANASDY